jgi:transcription termination factor Rho
MENYISISELKQKSFSTLTDIAKSLNVEGATGMRKQELIFAILQATVGEGGSVYGAVRAEILPDGFGFLRSPDYSYLPSPDDIYVSPSLIRRFSPPHRRLRLGADQDRERKRTLLCLVEGGNDQQ